MPTVSLVHTTWDFLQRQARGPIGAILRMRGIRMLRVLESPPLSLVTARSDFEPSTGLVRPPSVRHVGVTLSYGLPLIVMPMHPLWTSRRSAERSSGSAQHVV